MQVLKWAGTRAFDAAAPSPSSVIVIVIVVAVIVTVPVRMGDAVGVLVRMPVIVVVAAIERARALQGGLRVIALRFHFSEPCGDFFQHRASLDFYASTLAATSSLSYPRSL
ncbi:MAG: hypothetical protein IAI50_21985 [Candidatus Eremiobacteraeota bacterium]|nr:hypothetical protein [Candidatus Eremiobacteraeota bacterium]